MHTKILLPIAVFSLNAVAFQPPAPNGTAQSASAQSATIDKSVADLIKARNLTSTMPPDDRRKLIANTVNTNVLLFLTYYGSLQSFLSEIEQQRIDKQVGSTPNTAGTTSLVSKGSVPALLGFAVENGAATQTVDGTTITFRGNPIGLVKALAKKGYLESGVTENSQAWVKALDNFSVGLSFDVSRGGSGGTFTGSNRQLSAYSFRYDIVNHRDPRSLRYRNRWFDLVQNEQRIFAGSLGTFADDLDKVPDFLQWVRETAGLIADAADDKLVDSLLRSQLDKFQTIVIPAIRTAKPGTAELAQRAINAGNAFAQARAAEVMRELNSLIVTLEYAEVRQQSPAAGTMAAASGGLNVSTMTPGLPDLGTLRLILADKFVGNAEITANFSFTTFNNIPKGVKTGRFRDFQASVQLDTPMPDVMGIGKPTLTFSGLFLHLMEQPLGMPVMVNGQMIDSRGNVGFGQAKVEFPVKSLGIKIPLSLTYASRQELLSNEKNRIGANIGVTFDLDKIFAAKK